MRDPKPEPRTIDPDVYRLFHAAEPVCVHCGNRQVEAAHLISRKQGGDDVLANLIPLCHGCHEAFDKGMAYLGEFGKRVTPAAVRLSVAWFLKSEEGDDHCAYLIAKRGAFAAAAYVQRFEAGQLVQS